MAQGKKAFLSTRRPKISVQSGKDRFVAKDAPDPMALKPAIESGSRRALVLGSVSCCIRTNRQPISPADFFQDTPWLNVPAHRLGDLTAISTRPRGGLLGGSKLAALAAARKKRQEDAATAAASAIGKTAEPHQIATPLERCQLSNGRDVNSTSSSSLGAPKPQSLSGRPSTLKPSRTPPSPGHKERDSNAKPHSATPSLTTRPSLLPAVSRAPQTSLCAAPPTFATVLCGHSHREKGQPRLPFPMAFPYLPYGGEGSITDPSPFAGPSPDEVVLNAQAKGEQRAKRRSCTIV